MHLDYTVSVYCVIMSDTVSVHCVIMSDPVRITL